MTTAQRCLSQGPITVVYTHHLISRRSDLFSFLRRKKVFAGHCFWRLDMISWCLTTVPIISNCNHFARSAAIFIAVYNKGEQNISSLSNEGSVHGYRRAAGSSLCRISWNTKGGTHAAWTGIKKERQKSKASKINDTTFKVFLRLEIFYILSRLDSCCYLIHYTNRLEEEKRA